MELEEAGRRCTECNTLDYLPRECNLCREAFCESHYTPGTGHNCVAIETDEAGGFTAICPLCQQVVAIGPAENPHGVLARHIDAGCPKRKRENKKCAHCGKRDPVATQCKSCGQTYCLAHRLELDHTCEKIAVSHNVNTNRVASTARAGQKQSGHPAKSKTRTAKTGSGGRGRKEGSSELNLLVSSNEALGDHKIAAENRIPLIVYFPAGSKLAPLHMFFHSRHSVGKVLDTIELLVPALNKLHGEQDRLVMFAAKMGRSINQLPHMGILEELVRTGQVELDGPVVVELTENLPASWQAAFGPEARASAPLESSRRRRKSQKKSFCIVQ